MRHTLQFLAGILIAQITTFSLFWLNGDALDGAGALRVAVPSFFVALAISFWFGAIAKGAFMTEREKIRINAERAKERVRKEAQKEIVRETRKAHAKANFKVGAALAGVVGVGALFVMAQMVTAGLLLIAAGTGTIGGYYLRLRQERTRQLPSADAKVIETKPKRVERKDGR